MVGVERVEGAVYSSAVFASKQRAASVPKAGRGKQALAPEPPLSIDLTIPPGERELWQKETDAGMLTDGIIYRVLRANGYTMCASSVGRGYEYTDRDGKPVPGGYDALRRTVEDRLKPHYRAA